MKKFVLFIYSIAISALCNAQTIVDDFNYPVGPLTTVAGSDWMTFQTSCSPDVDISGRISSKIQCSFGTNLAYKPFALDFSENDTTKIGFTTALNGSVSSLSQAYVEIVSLSTNQNVAFGVATSNGSFYTSIFGTKNSTGFSQTGDILNPTATYFVQAEIIWKKDLVSNTYGELTLYLIDYSGKDQSLKKDNIIQSYKLPFTSLDGFENIYVRLSGNGTTLRATIQDIYFDQKEGLVTANEEKINKETLSLFPNPTTGKVYMTESKKWKVTDLLGNTILVGEGSEIDLTESENGIYFIQSQEETFASKQRIIKQ